MRQSSVLQGAVKGPSSEFALSLLREEQKNRHTFPANALSFSVLHAPSTQDFPIAFPPGTLIPAWESHHLS